MDTQIEGVALEVKYLTKNYGASQALRNVSFSVGRGQVLGLLGPNGAGKSTIMGIIAGQVLKSSGLVKICGLDVDAHPGAAKQRIGYLPEHSPLPVNMTVCEFLDFSSDLKKVPKQRKKAGIDYAINQTGLQAVSHRLIRNISKGFRQRVGIAQALIGSPELIVLDEPLDGLDPEQIVGMRALVGELGKKYTVLFSSHILAEIELLCSRAIVLYRGRVLADDLIGDLAPPASGHGFKIKTDATQAQVSAALAEAGIDVSGITPMGAPLEETYVKLISGAEPQ